MEKYPLTQRYHAVQANKPFSSLFFFPLAGGLPAPPAGQIKKALGLALGRQDADLRVSRDPCRACFVPMAAPTKLRPRDSQPR